REHDECDDRPDQDPDDPDLQVFLESTSLIPLRLFPDIRTSRCRLDIRRQGLLRRDSHAVGRSAQLVCRSSHQSISLNAFVARALMMMKTAMIRNVNTPYAAAYPISP